MAQEIIVRTLACDPARVTPTTPLAALGADDLDVAEIVFLCERALHLPEDSIWERVAVRPIRLTPGDLMQRLSPLKGE